MTRKAPIRTVAAFVLLASLVYAAFVRAASSDEENNITVSFKTPRAWR